MGWNPVFSLAVISLFLFVPGRVSAYSSYVKSITVLKQTNSRVDWSWARNVILLDECGVNSGGCGLGSGNYFDIYVINPDGTGERCLTCNSPLLPAKHKGNPEMDPTGNWVIFQAEKPGTTGAIADYFANPGSGVNNDVWIMDFATGQHVLRVTNTPATEGGVLHPHFSHRGDKILWAERYSSSGGPYGLWTLKVADFSVQNGNPTISNIQTFTPGAQQQFYESHGFSPDDTKIIFTANCQPGQSVYDTDIYSLNLQTGQLTDLTASLNTPPTQWNEHAHYSPTGNQIFWMTSEGIPRTDVNPATGTSNGQVKTDFWVMYPPDGASKIQLTDFNNPSAPEYIAGATHVTCADNAWNADGTRMVAGLITDQSTGAGEVVVINFNWHSEHLSTASYQPSLAPASITSVFGRGLASDALGIGPVGAPNALSPPASIGGTVISVTDSTGTTRQAELFGVTHGQVNYLIPAGTAPGPATVSVSVANPAWTGTAPNIPGPSSSMVVTTATIQVNNVAPGIFTANENGSGVPVGYIQQNNADGSQTYLNVFECGQNGCVTAPIDPTAGTQVARDLFGTGIRNAAQVSASIGGQSVPVLYAGSQNQYPGLDQVVLLIPRSLAGLGQTNISLTADGVAANTAQVSFR